MKKIGWFLVTLFLIGLPLFRAGAQTAPAPSPTTPTTYEWGDKLKRGAINTVTSPVEVAREVQMTSEKETMLKGWTIGLVKGFGQGFMRFGAGVVDMLTCPFNWPDEHKGPLLDPEYVWQKPGVRYS